MCHVITIARYRNQTNFLRSQNSFCAVASLFIILKMFRCLIDRIAVEYKLPDGSVMNIGAEAFRAPELLFHPELAGYEYAGVHQCVANAVHRADMDLRRNLYSNIVLAGGSTLFPGTLRIVVIVLSAVCSQCHTLQFSFRGKCFVHFLLFFKKTCLLAPHGP